MLLTITVEDLDTVENHGSIVRITGTADNGDRVTFAGDTRAMNGMAEFVEELGDVVVDVEDWQILSTTNAA